MERKQPSNPALHEPRKLAPIAHPVGIDVGNYKARDDEEHIDEQRKSGPALMTGEAFGARHEKLGRMTQHNPG